MQRGLAKAIIWVLWIRRNIRNFEGMHNLILDVQKLIYSWTRGNPLFSGTNIHEFIVELERLVA